MTCGVFLYAKQVEPQRYTHTVTGKIIRNEAQRFAGATVYVGRRNNRPLHGRLTCTHAEKDGTFSITFTNEPSEYCVSAHTGETGRIHPVYVAQRRPFQRNRRCISPTPPLFRSTPSDGNHLVILQFHDRSGSANQEDAPSISTVSTQK